jgi:hypothetical protein
LSELIRRSLRKIHYGIGLSTQQPTLRLRIVAQTLRRIRPTDMNGKSSFLERADMDPPEGNAT